MKNGYRKIIAWVLLLPAAAPFLFLTAFHTRQFLIRQEMAETLCEKKLTTIILDASAIHWIRPGAEACIGGKLFDIKQVSAEPGGLVSLTGLFDEKEETLLTRLQQDQEEDSQTGEFLSGFFQLCWKLSGNHHHQLALQPVRYCQPVNDLTLSPLHTERLTPPPQRS